MKRSMSEVYGAAADEDEICGLSCFFLLTEKDIL